MKERKPTTRRRTKAAATPMREVIVDLGYSKQGDDLTFHMADNGGVAQHALKAHARQMAAVSKRLDELADSAFSSHWGIDAEGHNIVLSVPPPLADELIKRGLAEPLCSEEDEAWGDNAVREKRMTPDELHGLSLAMADAKVRARRGE